MIWRSDLEKYRAVEKLLEQEATEMWCLVSSKNCDVG